MKSLWRSYGPTLITVFFSAVTAWCLILILLPQVTMFERALLQPKRQLDSSIAGALARDASTCAKVLEGYQVQPKEEQPSTQSGLAIPSASSMAVPSASSMAVPSASSMAVPSASSMAVPSASSMAVPSASSMVVPSASSMAVPSPSTTSSANNNTSQRPYIIQCDRSDTHKVMVRTAGEKVYLDELYNLPLLQVIASDSIETQSETALEIASIAESLHQTLLNREAKSSLYSFGNFKALVNPVLIPASASTAQSEDQQLGKQLLRLAGLRYTSDGAVYERIGLIIMVRTLMFALFATVLSLLICYPVAFKLAFATKPEYITWLFLALVIPYAIVELMRVYAWTSIVDNHGLLNSLLHWLGAIDLNAGGAIPFKRYAGTVFLVIVYTYVLFMVFPMVNVMSTLDKNQLEAARDLGASWLKVHWRIIIPHAKPGITVGCIATFMLAAGAFSVPRIISRGLQSEWFTQTIYNKFFESENSNIGAAYSLSYTVICFALVALFMAFTRTRLADFVRTR